MFFRNMAERREQIRKLFKIWSEKNAKTRLMIVDKHDKANNL